MALRRGSRTARPDAGFALIEVVVSALVMVTTTAGVISLLSATGRSGDEQRHRSQAFSLAQEDQARLRAIQITSLNNAMTPVTATLNGTTYTITSKATFISDETSTANCSSSSVSADYVRVGSEVTWPKMRAAPVVLESIVAPVSGSLDSNHGSLAITVTNAASKGISGVELSGTGTGTFRGYTDSSGCVLFGGLPSGNYTLTPSLGSEYVDFNGKAPAAKSISVAAGTTTPIGLQYDRGGAVNLSFQVKKPNNSEFQPSTSDSVVAVNTGMQSGAKAFWTSNKLPATNLAATPLFPFTDSYSFYAGSCEKNKPSSGGATATVTPGGEVSKTITLPGLYLKVTNSSGTALEGAKVSIVDNECPTALKQTYTTIAGGAIPDPGLPSSASYTICASAVISSSTRRMTVTKAVQSLTGTSVEIKLPSSGSSTACW